MKNRLVYTPSYELSPGTQARPSWIGDVYRLPDILRNFFLALFAFGTPNEKGDCALHGWRGLSIIGMDCIFSYRRVFSRADPGQGPHGAARCSAASGNDVSFIETFKRHLLDCIDLTCFGLVAVIVIKNNPKAQRIGDLWAKTIVIGGDTAYCVLCHEPLEISANEIVSRKFQCPSCHAENVYTQGYWKVASPADVDQGNASGVRL